MTAVQLGINCPTCPVALAQRQRQALSCRLLLTATLEQLGLQNGDGLLLSAVRSCAGLNLRAGVCAHLRQLGEHGPNGGDAALRLYPVPPDTDAEERRQGEARNGERADEARSTEFDQARANHFLAPPNCAWLMGLVARPLVMM